MVVEKKHKIIIIVFFALYLLLGIIIFKDYGISWDEPARRENGIITVKYVLEGDKTLLESTHSHGTAFEVLLIFLEKILHLTDYRNIYLMRHLFTFLLFYTGVIFFYLLCADIFRSWKTGILGCLFLILSPRIFAHSFYNSKDIPFLVLFVISIYTLKNFLEKKSFLMGILHGLTCGILIDIRIPGIFVPFLTFLFFITDLLIIKTEKAIKIKYLRSFYLYIFSLVSFTILFWPVLWENPAYYFFKNFFVLSRYPWDWPVLYNGSYMMARDIPWHYIPVWLLISTPAAYTVFFTAGIILLITLIIKNPKKFYLERKNFLIAILWFFFPVTAIIVLKSVLYDEWRQIFFVYPAFIIFSLFGLTALFNYIRGFKKKSYIIIAAIIILFLGLNMFNTIFFMIKYHPFQNLYFNRLAGKNMSEVKKKFELDYWGLTYRNGLEYILKNDKRDGIKIAANTVAAEFNFYILPEKDRKRLLYIENLGESDYFLSNYKFHPEEYTWKGEIYSIEMDGAKIFTVYKIR